MKLQYYCNQNIPQLAWCAVVEKGSDIVRVEIGNSVYHSDNFFVAGVWDGKLSDGDFDTCNFACCTGANVNKCKSGGVKFSTPSHLLETIFGIRSENSLFVSNSLAFALVRSGSELDINYMNYQRDLCSSIFGQKKQICASPLKNGRSLQYFRACNFEISSGLTIHKEEKRSNLDFSNYDKYYKSVISVLNLLQLNASDKLRSKQYSSISTISRGYDAVASSVLAKKIGCDSVITFNRPKKYTTDCGTEIAQTLGYKNIYEEDANTYLSAKDLVEAECIASGDVGSTIIFAAHKDLLADSIIFMGVRGDSLWEREHENVNDNQDFTNGNTLQQADHNFVETCLSENAVCIPVPMIGADRWTELAQLSNSEEMKPYSVRRKYDRPIPRRIAESVGVARNSFGQVKAGAGISFHYDSYKRILRKMSPAAQESLERFRQSYKPSLLKCFGHNFRFYLSSYPVYANYFFSLLNMPFRIKHKEKYISSPWSSLLIHWSIEQMRKRYINL